MKRIVIIIGFLLLSLSALVGVASATPPSGAHPTTLGRISLGPYHETSPAFLNVPPGGLPRIDAPAPGNCPF